MAIVHNGVFDDNWTGGSSHVSSHNWGSLLTNQVYTAAITIVSPDATVRSITSITDNEGNTWRRVDAVSRTDFTTDITGAPIAAALEVWKTVAASSPASGSQFTFNFSGTVDSIVVVVDRFGGCDLTHPLDLNGTLPAHDSHANGSTTTPTISGLSTNTANPCIFEAQAGIGNSGTQSTSPHLISGSFSDFSDSPAVFGGTNAARSSMAGKIFSAQQTGFTCDGGSAANNWLMIVFALTADTQPAPGLAARNYRALIG